MSSFKNIICFCIAIFSALTPCFVYAQLKDTTVNSLPQKNKDIFKTLIKSVTRSGIDSSMQANVLNNKNEAAFLPYEGKGIRNIIITQFGFEKILTDTSKKIRYFGKKIIAGLHRNTKEWVIRDNLFIKEKTALNATLVGDNERYLRSLEYIHDARILVDTIPGKPDSVDLVVITKDFLSITAELNDASTDRFKMKIGDANLMGIGQKLQVTALLEKKRGPDYGYEVLYRKNSIASTFINASVGFTTINPDLAYGTGDEHAWHAKLERPLVSQYLHFAGAILVGNNQTFNNYMKPDSIFYNYHYNTFDGWIGYNLGVRKLLFFKHIKNRQFISLRYFRNRFIEVPYQVKDQFNFIFNDRQAMLAQFTFFSQTFYKANYIYGFGITEDIPYGYNIALTSGWYKQLNLERFYTGVDANRYIVTYRGNVMQYFLRTGTFFNKGKFQDAAVLAGISMFSRVFSHKNLRIRQYLRLSYTKQFNRIGLEPLGINNTFGLRYFRIDSVSGNQRISLHTESFFFLKYKLLGFKFAPFVFGDAALLTPKFESLSKTGFYYGLGGGLRIRNENVILGTIELRFIYFPRNSQQSNVFKLTFNSNIRFRYNSNYVKAPDIIQLNSDYNNSIY